MEKEGKYIYCIIASSMDRMFGPIGIGERKEDVLTISYNDLSMVVSSHPLSKVVVNRDNLLAHERIIEKVMEEFDSVLPVRFGTVAASADEIRNLLGRRYREFQNALRDAEHKTELNVKGIWKNMDEIFKEVVDENKEIKKAKEAIQKDIKKENIQAKTEVGRMVAKVLQAKKTREGEGIVAALRRTFFDFKLNETASDEMFMNAAFLVDKGREKEFENILDDLSEKYRQRIKFMVVGPLPVFNFVNIVIYPEEWEK
jgi:hypothetical protein